MSLEDKLDQRVTETIAVLVKDYSMPESLAELKYNEIKAYVKKENPNRSETYIVELSLTRIRNYARAYRNQGGWSG